jgi:hypothetical protein
MISAGGRYFVPKSGSALKAHEAAGVAQQVLDGDEPGVGRLGEPALDVVAEREPAFLHELQHDRGGQRLGGARDLEALVGPYRLARLGARQAAGCPPAAFAGERDRHARGRHVLQHFVERIAEALLQVGGQLAVDRAAEVALPDGVGRGAPRRAGIGGADRAALVGARAAPWQCHRDHRGQRVAARRVVQRRCHPISISPASPLPTACAPPPRAWRSGRPNRRAGRAPR